MTVEEAQRRGYCKECGFAGKLKKEPPCIYDRMESLDYKRVGKGNCAAHTARKDQK